MLGNNPNSQNATKVRFRANGSGPIEVSRNARSNKTDCAAKNQKIGAKGLIPIQALLYAGWLKRATLASLVKLRKSLPLTWTSVL